MADISKVTVTAYDAASVYEDAENAKGIVIAPESETKKVVIPSPPSTKYVPINPRDAIVYVTDEVITETSAVIDTLKAYAVDNKVVILCPAGREAEDIAAAGVYAFNKAKTLNVKTDGISVGSSAAYLEAAQDAVDLMEEEDVEAEDAKEFSI